MVRRIVAALAALVALVVVAAAVLLGVAHRGIRAERSPLPSPLVLGSSLAAPDRPVRLTWINSASQAMTRGAVLDPAADPRPAEPYVMSHPSFVLEWADGRILLVDVGMTRDAALRFGRPLETLAGAGPIEPHVPVAEALGSAAARVRGVIFTHLHSDHVEALPTLCDAGAKFSVFMTRAQAERTNHTTRHVRDIVRATTCAEIVVLDDAPAATVPGFPGLAVVDAGGHTPGSQLIAARVRTDRGDRQFAFTGDIVNHVDGVAGNIGKPWAYRTFVVPEDEERLSELRQFLDALTRYQPPFELLVSHDRLQLEASSIALRTPD